MKKILVIIFLLVLDCTHVVALESDSKWKTTQPEMNKTSDYLIKTEIQQKPKKNQDGKEANQYIVTYIIPEDYKEENLRIVPEDYMNQVDFLNEQDTFTLMIENHSPYSFQYIENSVVFATEDLEMYSDLEIGAWIEEAIGFNHLRIREGVAFPRIKNSAIQSLYRGKSKEQIEDSALEDSVLDRLLRNLGYGGIQELNRFYLDFYNQKYQLSATKLEELSTLAMIDLLSGPCTKEIKESSKEIIELSYNYFHNQLFSFSLKSQTNNQQKVQSMSIGSYMRKEESYQELDKKIKEQAEFLLPKKVVQIELPNRIQNRRQLPDIYKDYYSRIYFELSFSKTNLNPGPMELEKYSSMEFTTPIIRYC